MKHKKQKKLLGHAAGVGLDAAHVVGLRGLDLGHKLPATAAARRKLRSQWACWVVFFEGFGGFGGFGRRRSFSPPPPPGHPMMRKK